MGQSCGGVLFTTEKQPTKEALNHPPPTPKTSTPTKPTHRDPQPPQLLHRHLHRLQQLLRVLRDLPRAAYIISTRDAPARVVADPVAQKLARLRGALLAALYLQGDAAPARVGGGEAGGDLLCDALRFGFRFGVSTSVSVSVRGRSVRGRSISCMTGSSKQHPYNPPSHRVARSPSGTFRRPRRSRTAPPSSPPPRRSSGAPGAPPVYRPARARAPRAQHRIWRRGGGRGPLCWWRGPGGGWGWG